MLQSFVPCTSKSQTNAKHSAKKLAEATNNRKLIENSEISKNEIQVLKDTNVRLEQEIDQLKMKLKKMEDDNELLQSKINNKGIN